MTRRQTRPETCDGFAWVGQGLLCCDDCGQPWFLHPGDATWTGLFPAIKGTKPFTPEQQAQIPALVAAWEANALWQREATRWKRDALTNEDVAGPQLERQVGKDFPYSIGRTREVASDDTRLKNDPSASCCRQFADGADMTRVPLPELPNAVLVHMAAAPGRAHSASGIYHALALYGEFVTPVHDALALLKHAGWVDRTGDGWRITSAGAAAVEAAT